MKTSMSDRTLSVSVCSSFKFISEASPLNLLFFCVLNLVSLGIQSLFTVS